MEETEFKGIERLKAMLAEFEDGYSLKAVVDYLITKTDMDEKFLNEEKSLKGMEKFITERARNLAVNNVAMVKDNMVYSWGVVYFSQSNDFLGIKKEQPKTETASKTKTTKKTTVKETVAEPADNKEEESTVEKTESPQMSVFEGVK